MHIVIGIITAMGGLIWALVALQKTGFDISSLNPLDWQRRNAWKKKYEAKPIYKLSQPIDVAALLLLGVAKCEGEISAEQKQKILNILQENLHLSLDDANDQLLASAHLLRDEIYLVDNIDKVLMPSSAEFSNEQVNSLIVLMGKVANIEGEVNLEQQKLIDATNQYFAKIKKDKSGWS